MTPKNSPQPKKKKKKKKNRKKTQLRGHPVHRRSGAFDDSETTRERQETESQRERGSEASLVRTRLLESSEIVLRKFLGRCLLANSDHFLIAAELRGEKKQKKNKKSSSEEEDRAT
jgi:hypothetical protein